MTLKSALKLSIKKWEYLSKNPEDWEEIANIIPELSEYTFDCPLCQIYLKREFYTWHHIKGCPLFEEKNKVNDGQLCCEDFHDFADYMNSYLSGVGMYNNDEEDKEKAIVCANSIVARLKEALREESK